jgi:hypothetical protein
MFFLYNFVPLSGNDEHIFLVKVKVKTPCALTKHHDMKKYWGNRGIAPLIL